MNSGGKLVFRKQTKCKCAGKYGYTCGSDLKNGATDKGACAGLNVFASVIKMECKK